MFIFYGPNWTFGLNYIRVSISRIAQPVRKWKEFIFFFLEQSSLFITSEEQVHLHNKPYGFVWSSGPIQTNGASRIFRASEKYNKKIQKIALEK